MAALSTSTYGKAPDAATACDGFHEPGQCPVEGSHGGCHGGDGYELLAVRIQRGIVIDGAIVALCPDAHGNVTADVCIPGPPVP